MQLAHLEELLNNSFNYVKLTAEEEASIAACEYQCVMLDHAEDLENYDYWSIQPDISWKQ
jgi:hypothetical protein